MSDISKSTQDISILDDSSGTSASVNSEGRLLVATTPDSSIAGSTFSVDSGFRVATTAGTDNPILLVKNPSGSGKTLKLVTRFYGCNVNNVLVTYKLYLNPTITSNGTSLTINATKQSSPPSTVATAFYLPTISSNGTLIDTYVIGQNSTGVQIKDDLIQQLDSNNNWLITADPGSNNRAVDISLKWQEI